MLCNCWKHFYRLKTLYQELSMNYSELFYHVRERFIVEKANDTLSVRLDFLVLFEEN